jgi:hypothetical protein
MTLELTLNNKSPLIGLTITHTFCGLLQAKDSIIVCVFVGKLFVMLGCEGFWDMDFFGFLVCENP